MGCKGILNSLGAFLVLFANAAIATQTSLPTSETKFLQATGFTFHDLLNVLRANDTSGKSRFIRKFKSTDFAEFADFESVELKKLQASCDRIGKDQLCQSEVKSMQTQIDETAKLLHRFDGIYVDQKFALTLEFYWWKMKNSILRNEIDEWTHSCGRPEHINTARCKTSIVATYQPLKILESLFLVAKIQSETRHVAKEDLKDLELTINTYDQIR